MRPIPASQDAQKALTDALDAAQWDIVHMTRKDEIVEYYQDEYKRGWKQKLTRDLGAFLGRKSKNLEKRFDPQRLHSPEKRNASQYEAFGRTLPGYKRPRNLRGKRAKVNVDVEAKVSKDDIHREYNDVLGYDETNELLETGAWNAIFENYGINPRDVGYVDKASIRIDFI